jgi:hypothetical protein
MPGEFEPQQHYYPRVLNATLHPAVAFFMNLGPRRVLTRYCHLNPRVDAERLEQVLTYRPTYFQWAGADLFHVTTAAGNRQMVVIETNSCPSGHKSMPHPSDTDEQGGYRALVERAFLPLLASRRLPQGGLAVIFDKNEMEAAGYAAALADATGEPVHLTAFHDGDADPAARFDDAGVLQVRAADGAWLPIRAAFRYVTQRPWNRIPVTARTALLNPVVACLAGGRNKMLAAKAYDIYNAELEGSGLQIRTPETIWNVSHHEIPLWVKRLGGLAVIKVPYANAGQGVYTITSARELERFMEVEQRYGQFIVQSLVGNFRWSSGRRRRLYHVGTVPDKRRQIFVADLRVMVGASPEGFRPLAIYGRRARAPLSDRLEPEASSWEMLGTNLSLRREDGGWEADTARLMMMDRKDFNILGLGIDDLVEAFIQTVLAVIAIDRFCAELFTRKGKFRVKLFRSLENDPALVEEVLL